VRGCGRYTEEEKRRDEEEEEEVDDRCELDQTSDQKRSM
jgi:hypothetical protein